jgi:hypothetical protein
MSHIVGVFRDSAAATRAVDQLVEAHFAPRREIVVRASNAAGVSEEVPGRPPHARPARAAARVVLRAPRGRRRGRSRIGIPRFPPRRRHRAHRFIAAGLGALIGVLWGLTYWSGPARLLAVRVNDESPIEVSVDATNLRGRADEARLIFERAGAIEVH